MAALTPQVLYFCLILCCFIRVHCSMNTVHTFLFQALVRCIALTNSKLLFYRRQDKQGHDCNGWKQKTGTWCNGFPLVVNYCFIQVGNMANRLEPALACSPTSSQVIEDSTVHRSKSVRSVLAEEFPKILHQVYIFQLFRDTLNYKMML